jgi:ABC-type lipoprotein release transport system permease subunit
MVPWSALALVVIAGYAASLLTTYMPARRASRVYPAEALRYE